MLTCTLEDDADVVVQSGIGWEELNAQLKEMNYPYFFPVCLTTVKGTYNR